MEEAKKFLNAWFIVILSLCYSYFLASKIPKGILRFFSLLPIFSLFTLLPLTFSRPLPTLILSPFITWLANFKLLLYSFNLGPLSTNDQQSSLFRFIFFAAFPLKIKGQNKVNPSKTQKVNGDDQKGSFGNEPKKVGPLIFGLKCFVFVILDGVYRYNKNILVLCCLMYLFIDTIFGVCDLVMGPTLGLELDPPSDEPYLSTSLQDFWGRRWNRMISDALRHTIYKPVRSMAMGIVGHRWASLLGMMSSFTVSGLMHELIYYYVTRRNPTWEVTWFFVLHGVCVVLEMAVKRALGQKWGLHWAISGPLTVGFVIGTGMWLFFPQIMRNRVDVKAGEDAMEIAKYMKEMVVGK